MIFQLSKNFTTFHSHDGPPSLWRKIGLVWALFLRRAGLDIIIHHNNYDRKFMRQVNI